MPLTHVHYPAGTLAADARDALAEELTQVALDCEKLPATPFIKSTCWIYFHELPDLHVYQGGEPGGLPVVSLDVNAFEGGFDADGKTLLFTRLTQAIRTHMGIPEEALAPVYIFLHAVDPTDWGVFGTTITLDDIRNADPEAKPIQ